MWIAWSGGMDSSTLLHLAIQQFGSARCHAIHVNHQLNPDAHRWAEQCVRQANDLGVSLDTETGLVAPGNVELQARLQRYRIFTRKLSADDIMMTGHQQDDDVETLLWQLFTGRALIGIPAHRKLGDGELLRPLLSVSKKQLMEYAKLVGISWIEDKSNADLTFDRNWLRHEFLPNLRSRFPTVAEQILNLKTEELVPLSRQPLEIRQDASLTAELVRRWLLAFGLNPPSTRVDEVIKQSQARADANPAVRLSPSIIVARYRNHLYVTEQTQPFQPQDVVVGTPAQFGNGRLEWVEVELGGLADQLILWCTNRSNVIDTSIRVRTGQLHRTLSSIFQEYGVPPWLRSGWPVLQAGEEYICVPRPGSNDTSSHDKPGTSTGSYLPVWFPTE